MKIKRISLLIMFLVAAFQVAQAQRFEEAYKNNIISDHDVYVKANNAGNVEAVLDFFPSSIYEMVKREDLKLGMKVC